MAESKAKPKDIAGCLQSAIGLCVTTPLWLCLMFWIISQLNAPVWVWVVYWTYVPFLVAALFVGIVVKLLDE